VINNIYNVHGQLIRTLDLGRKDAGYYTTKERAGYWDGRNAQGERVSSGVYFYTIKAGNFVTTQKLAIVK
jgi:flagellar hook assembly protein FlgD